VRPRPRPRPRPHPHPIDGLRTTIDPSPGVRRDAVRWPRGAEQSSAARTIKRAPVRPLYTTRLDEVLRRWRRALVDSPPIAVMGAGCACRQFDFARRGRSRCAPGILRLCPSRPSTTRTSLARTVSLSAVAPQRAGSGRCAPLLRRGPLVTALRKKATVRAARRALFVADRRACRMARASARALRPGRARPLPVLIRGRGRADGARCRLRNLHDRACRRRPFGSCGA